MTTTAQFQNGIPANDNTTAAPKLETNEMTTFRIDQLGEEAKGFYASLDSMDQILNQVRGLYGKKNTAIFEFLEAQVYDVAPIASRAVVCLYRADYVETLIHAGLKKDNSSDEKTLKLLTIVHTCYLKLHDRAMGVRMHVFHGPARKKNRAKIEAFLTMKIQKQAQQEVLKETVKEPMLRAGEFLLELQSGINAMDARVNNVYRECGELVARLGQVSDENKALKEEVAKLKKEADENRVLLTPLRKIAEDAVKVAVTDTLKAS